MAKTRISSTDLLWIFREKLSSFDERFKVAPIAIVPSEDDWEVGRTVIETPSRSLPSGLRKSRQSCEPSTGWRGTEVY